MGVKLVFLGRLADLAGAPEREVSAPLDWSGLLDAVQGDLGGWLASDKVRRQLDGASPRKVIVVPGKLVNVVV